MTLQYSNPNTRNDNSMPDFCRFQRPTMVCRDCQCDFSQYKGMKRMGASPIARCPGCKEIYDEKKAAKHANDSN